MKKFLTLFTFLILSLAGIEASGADYKTLFAYPSAPDTCSTTESRFNYCTLHFWDNFDVTKQLTPATDSLLVTAMSDFISFMKQANGNVALGAIRSLMFKAQANKPNFMKLMDAASLLLYLNNPGVKDDVYLTFLKCVLDASWVSGKDKALYKDLYSRIDASRLGAEMPNIDVSDGSGKKKLYDLPADSAQMVLLFFTGDDADSPLERTRLSVDVGVNESIKAGYMKVINIYTGKNTRQFLAEASQYPNWTLVASPEVYKQIDVRGVPSLFILDNKHVIQTKNVTVDFIKRAFYN